MGIIGDIANLFGIGPESIAIDVQEKSDMADRALQLQIAQKNWEMQQAEFDWKKDLQRQIFQREDTAMQRKMADLQKVGMNPILALGGAGAGAGAQVMTKAPQFTPELGENPTSKASKARAQMYHKMSIMQGALQLRSMAEKLLQQKANVSKTEAQEELIKAQTKSKNKDIDIANELDIPVGKASGVVQVGQVVKSAYRDAIKNIKDEMKKKWKDIKDMGTEKKKYYDKEIIYEKKN